MLAIIILKAFTPFIVCLPAFLTQLSLRSVNRFSTTKHLNGIQETYTLNARKPAHVLDVERLKLLRVKRSVLYVRAKIMLSTEKELKIGRI